MLTVFGYCCASRSLHPTGVHDVNTGKDSVGCGLWAYGPAIELRTILPVNCQRCAIVSFAAIKLANGTFRYFSIIEPFIISGAFAVKKLSKVQYDEPVDSNGVRLNCFAYLM